MTEEEAKGPATAKLREIERASGIPVSFAGEAVATRSGWLFFYNSTAYLERGDFLDMLGGNGPIHVAASGDVQIVPSFVDYTNPDRLERHLAEG